MKPASLPLLSALVCALAAAPAFAQTTSAIGASADAFVSSAFPARNFGGAGALYVAGTDTQSGDVQTLLKFDFSSTKTQFDTAYGAGNWFVQSVVLELTSSAGGNAIFAPQFNGTFAASWMTNDLWLEGLGTPNLVSTAGLTYNSLPLFLSGADEPLGAFAFNAATGGANGTPLLHALNISSGLAQDILGGGTSSVRLFSTDPDLSYLTYGRIFSATPGFNPVLTITAAPIPEPAAATVLSALGALALAWAGRRRRGALTAEPPRGR